MLLPVSPVAPRVGILGNSSNAPDLSLEPPAIWEHRHISWTLESGGKCGGKYPKPSDLSVCRVLCNLPFHNSSHYLCGLHVTEISGGTDGDGRMEERSKNWHWVVSSSWGWSVCGLPRGTNVWLPHGIGSRYRLWRESDTSGGREGRAAVYLKSSEYS